MADFIVNWRVEIEAGDSFEAVREARRMMRDPENSVLVFDVFDQQGYCDTFDLVADPDPDLESVIYQSKEHNVTDCLELQNRLKSARDELALMEVQRNRARAVAKTLAAAYSEGKIPGKSIVDEGMGFTD